MGEEYAEKHPFPFFCSFSDPPLIEAVRRGRQNEFAALRFEWGIEIPDPQSPETFMSAKLAWAWPEGSFHEQLRRLYQDLLIARREHPALRDRAATSATLIPDNQDAQPAVLVLGAAAKKDCSPWQTFLRKQRPFRLATMPASNRSYAPRTYATVEAAHNTHRLNNYFLTN